MTTHSHPIIAQNTYQLLEPTVIDKASTTTFGSDLTLSGYVTGLYGAALLIGAVLAVIVIIIGGGMYITGKSLPNIQKARQWLKNGVIGIIIFISIALLLNTINPAILNLDKIFTGSGQASTTNQSNNNNQNQTDQKPDNPSNSWSEYE